MDDVRPTLAVVGVMNVFVSDVGERQYGYKLARETKYSSAKVYQILARLTEAGWLVRHDDPSASPESGGPPRVTYTLHPNAVASARRMVAEARNELAPARKRRLPGAIRALGFLS